MTVQHDLLTQNIELFIRKFYRFKLLKGILMAVLLLCSALLFFSAIEFFAYLPPSIRMVIFYLFIGLSLYILVFYLAIPLYRLFRYRKQMSDLDAAILIGRHFSEQVNDKLLNTLQLKEKIKLQPENDLLVEAIKQRTAQLSLFQFSHAVKNNDLVKLFRWVAIPLMLVLVIWAVFPDFVEKPASRIVDYKTVYQKPLPYEVTLLTTKLEVVQHDDFIFKLEVTGDEIPTDFYVETEGLRYQMETTDLISRTYLFKKVAASIDFVIVGGDYRSQRMTLEVRPKPLLLSYKTELDFPSYTGRVNETVRDLTFLSVPEGSALNWTFSVKDTDSLLVSLDSIKFIVTAEKGEWFFTHRILKSTRMVVIPVNKFAKQPQGIEITIDAIQDAFPDIQANQISDSLISRWSYFSGIIGDDYGFSALYVDFERSDETSGGQTTQFRLPVQIQNNALRQPFFYNLHADSLGLKPGERVSFRFEVLDNDGINGPKASFSRYFNFKLTSEATLDSISNAKDMALTDKLETVLEKAREVRKDAEQMNRNLMMKKEVDWNDKQQLKKLMENQENLQREVEDLKQERQSLLDFNQNNNLQNEKLLEKQARIDDLLEKVIPEDIRKMMEDLQKLLQDMNKDQMSDALKNMELSGEEMEKMLDRNLSLLEQLQVEKQMNELIEQMKKLSDDLQKNADLTEDRKTDIDKAREELNKIDETLNNQLESLQEIKEKNKTLEEPFNLGETEEPENELLKEMNESKESLDSRKREQSSKSQRKASEKLKKLGNELSMMMQQSEEEQLEEDAVALRFLLENVIRISKNTESLMDQFNVMKRDDPAFVDLMKQQGLITESFRVVEDSLLALGKRQPMIENFVFDEVGNVKRRMNEVQQALKDRIMNQVQNSQQFAMMGLNNLALMLAESLKNMQESMGMPNEQAGNGKGKGKSKSKQPGKSLQQMRELQESLGKQLKEAMKGKQDKGTGKGMSEQLARMAAQQEALRNELKKMIEDLKSEGHTGDNGLNKVLENMEKFEEGLVNKELNQRMLDMNNDIVVRLLESEKAQKERDKEERRESDEFKGVNSGNPAEIPEYNKMLERQQESLKTLPVQLQPFYKRLANEYFMRSNR